MPKPIDWHAAIQDVTAKAAQERQSDSTLLWFDPSGSMAMTPSQMADVATQITSARPAPSRSYYLPIHGGKYHRANPITGQALCRGTILLDTTAMPMQVADNATRVHPMVCRRCLATHHNV